MNESAFFEEEPLPDRSLAPLSSWERAEFPEKRDPLTWNHHRIKARITLTDIYSQRRADEKKLSDALDQNLENLEKKQGPDTGSQTAPEDDRQWMLAQFKSFIEHLQGRMEGTPAGGDPPDAGSDQTETPVPAGAHSEIRRADDDGETRGIASPGIRERPPLF